MNRRLWIFICSALPVVALAACSRRNIDGRHGALALGAQAVHISTRGAPRATIDRNGTLLIGGQAIALTPAEQQLARHYYRDARRISSAGAATGKAGGKLGVTIVGSLFSALWHDDSSIVKRRAKQGSAQISADIHALCAHLGDLRSVQNALAAAQPAFAPYRIIHRDAVAKCVHGNHDVTVTY